MIWDGDMLPGRWFALFLGLVCAVLTSCDRSRHPAIVEAESSRRGQDLALAFRTLVYSEAFSQKFHLPSAGVRRLENGVHALALRISDDSELGAVCALDMYLNDEFDFAYPHGTEGSFAELRRGAKGALGFFTEAFSEDSKLMPLEQRFREPRALFRSLGVSAAKQRGEFHMLPAESFYREVAPELSLASFEPICSVLRSVDGVEVWLLRKGQSPDDLAPTTVPPAAVALRVEIPKALLSHSAKALDEANRRQENAPIRQAKSNTDPLYVLPPAE